MQSIKPHIKSVLLLACTVLASYSLRAQGLQQKVDLRYIDVPLRTVLSQMEQRYALHFTYSPDLIPLNESISVDVQGAPLADAIDDICQQLSLQYKALGAQIMLKPDNRKNEQLSRLEPRKGKVEQKSPIYPPSQEHIEQRLRMTQVVKPLHQRSTPTIERPGGDSYQAFQLDLSKLPPPPSEQDLPPTADKRLAQISILPYVGTNLGQSDEITNNVSVNLLWGTNGGVDGLEVGLLYNQVKQDVNGLQIAGLGSSVNGDVRGTQVAGLFNTNGGRVQGLQAAGLFNLSRSGGQAIQAAGLFNVSKGDFAGLQASGLFNIAQGKAEGMQIGLLFNHSEGKTRSQVSGLFNQAGDVEGGQISPLLNIADDVAGFQVGLINIADTVSGVPIGLLNIVKNGYNRFELSANDALYANASLKLGAYSFYNIFQAGLRWDDHMPSGSGESSETQISWGLGYGIGTTLPLGKYMLLNVEAVSLQVNELERWSERLNLLNQLRLTFDYHGVDRRTSVFLGPVFHLMWSKVQDAETGVVGSRVINPSYTLFEDSNGSRNIKGWIGLQGGVRF